MPDTIFALATPTGGAIAIIRISGPEAGQALSRCFTGRCAHRTMAYGTLMDGDTPIDQAMGALFQAPHSYTGEDMAELYIHGGQAVAARAMQSLSSLGLRIAEPGEFTQRAFLNGKLDLSRAEAVMDLIGAVSGRASASALEQLQGRLSHCIRGLQAELTDMLSGIDAAIDYPEELEEDVSSGLPAAIPALKARIDALIAQGMAARVIREGVRIAILGRPNAGKSTLFNALLGEDRAIVTAAPGTTRDVLEGETIVNGIRLRLFDTAGIREAADEAESIGVERALEASGRAELLLIALPADEAPGEAERRLLALPGKKLAVITKLDAAAGSEAFALAESCGTEALGVSALTGEGIPALLWRMAALPPEGESAILTNSRHIAALERAAAALSAAHAAIPGGLDCVATDLHAALHALGEITGDSVDAQVLDRIFQRFCVGK